MYDDYYVYNVRYTYTYMPICWFSLPYLIAQCTVTDYLEWATTASVYFLIQYSLAPLAFDAMQSDSGKNEYLGDDSIDHCGG